MDLDWRKWVRRLVTIWRSSLLVRTVAITLVLSTLAVGVIGAFVSITVGNNLSHSRTQQLLPQADNATSLVQNLFNTTNGTGATTSTEDAAGTAYTDVLQSASNSSHFRIAILRSPGQPGAHVPSDRATPSPNFTIGLISKTLRAEVQTNANK